MKNSGMSKKERALRLLDTMKREIRNGLKDGVDNDDLYLLIAFATDIENLIK